MRCMCLWSVNRKRLGTMTTDFNQEKPISGTWTEKKNQQASGQAAFPSPDLGLAWPWSPKCLCSSRDEPAGEKRKLALRPSALCSAQGVGPHSLLEVRLSASCRCSSCLPKVVWPVSGHGGTGSLVCLLEKLLLFLPGRPPAGALTAPGWGLSSPRRSWAGRALHPHSLHHPPPSSLRLWGRRLRYDHLSPFSPTPRPIRPFLLPPPLKQVPRSRDF